MNPTHARHGLTALWCLLLAACAAPSERISDRHVRVENALSRQPVQGCRRPVIHVTDQRPHEQLGQRADGKPVTYPGLRNWTEELLRTSATEDPALGQLDVELVRAYFESHPSGHSFHLVMRARSAASETWRIYRGTRSGITWWGNDGEYGGYIESAGAKAVSALIRAEGTCQSAR